MPNPNELQRQIEERSELIRKLHHTNASKSTKEVWLRELRELERKMGVEGYPYNSSAFGGPDGDTGR